jgi:hypothetical protein
VPAGDAGRTDAACVDWRGHTRLLHDEALIYAERLKDVWMLRIVNLF